ncbi:MAG: 6-phosphofructokinase [Firmicutes bacterium]|nr:6-phosphofructokinase [Bacillota bacterium]
MKKIAILTSGGDAPGMNSAIRAVVRYGLNSGMQVVGIERGYQGLVEGNFIEMTPRSVSNVLQKGGTILKTARCPDFKKAEVQIKAIETLKKEGIEGLIVIGGDGSFSGARALSNRGFPAIGIPGTIDNDLAYTDYTLGFDTACNTVLETINKLRDTMESHDRVAVVEVMGRNCGDIAVYTGVCGGAEVVVIPEVPFNMSAICSKLIKNKERGKLSGIVIIAEGVGKAESFAEIIKAKTKMNVRATVLGHMQRGGAPSSRDRYLGTNFGIHAVRLLEKGIGNRIVGIKNNKFIDVDIDAGLEMKKRFNKELYKMVGLLS